MIRCIHLMPLLPLRLATQLGLFGAPSPEGAQGSLFDVPPPPPRRRRVRRRRHTRTSSQGRTTPVQEHDVAVGGGLFAWQAPAPPKPSPKRRTKRARPVKGPDDLLSPAQAKKLAERLHRRADSLLGEAKSSLNADRRMNTRRQQRMASNAILGAQRQDKLGRALRGLADAIDRGEPVTRADELLASDAKRDRIAFELSRGFRGDPGGLKDYVTTRLPDLNDYGLSQLDEQVAANGYAEFMREMEHPLPGWEMEVVERSVPVKVRRWVTRDGKRQLEVSDGTKRERRYRYTAPEGYEVGDVFAPARDYIAVMDALGERHETNDRLVRMPISQRNADAMKAAHRIIREVGHPDLAGYQGWAGMRDYLDLQTLLDVGYRSPKDWPAVKARWDRFWARASGGDAAPAGPAKPQRPSLSEPLTSRLERAEAEERKRYIPIDLQRIPGYVETPLPWVERMIEHLDLEEGMAVLEPSAGRGAIADRLPEGVDITVAEFSGTLREQLTAKGYDKVYSDVYNVEGQFDAIVMNPPWEREQDAEQLLHVWDNLLKPGGRVVAVLSAMTGNRSTKLSARIAELQEEHGIIEPDIIPPNDWRRSGKAVRGQVIVLEKPHE